MNVSDIMNATRGCGQLVASMASFRTSPVLLVRKQAGDITSIPGCHSSFRASAPLPPPDLMHTAEMSVCCVGMTFTIIKQMFCLCLTVME